MTIVPDILGEPVVYQVPDPGPGTPVNHSITKSGRWSINSINFEYSTSGVAGNRYPYIWFEQNGDHLIDTSVHDEPVPASCSIFITAAPGYSQEYSKYPAKLMMPLPRIFQIAGTFEIRIDAVNMDVADNMRKIFILASFWQDH